MLLLDDAIQAQSQIMHPFLRHVLAFDFLHVMHKRVKVGRFFVVHSFPLLDFVLLSFAKASGLAVFKWVYCSRMKFRS
jgi:hypothetical protein